MTELENTTSVKTEKIEKCYVNNFMKNLITFSNKFSTSTEKIAVFDESLLKKYIQ